MKAIGAVVTVAGLVFAFVVLFYVGAKLGFRLGHVDHAGWRHLRFGAGARPAADADAIAPTPGEFMTDEQQLADAFWQMNRAVLKINEILDRNPALAENLPVTPPRILDADEIAAECQVLAEYYEKLARG